MNTTCRPVACSTRHGDAWKSGVVWVIHRPARRITRAAVGNRYRQNRTIPGFGSQVFGVNYLGVLPCHWAIGVEIRAGIGMSIPTTDNHLIAVRAEGPGRMLEGTDGKQGAK